MPNKLSSFSSFWSKWYFSINATCSQSLNEPESQCLYSLRTYWLFFCFKLKYSILMRGQPHDLLSSFHLFRCRYFSYFSIIIFFFIVVAIVVDTVPYSYFTHCYQLTEKEIVYSVTICGNAICNRLLLHMKWRIFFVHMYNAAPQCFTNVYQFYLRFKFDACK